MPNILLRFLGSTLSPSIELGQYGSAIFLTSNQDTMHPHRASARTSAWKKSIRFKESHLDTHHVRIPLEETGLTVLIIGIHVGEDIPITLVTSITKDNYYALDATHSTRLSQGGGRAPRFPRTNGTPESPRCREATLKGTLRTRVPLKVVFERRICTVPMQTKCFCDQTCFRQW